MKLIAVLVIIFLILVSAFTLTKNLIAQAVIVNGVKAVTGLAVEIRGVDAGIFKNYLSLQHLTILNPGDFSDRSMADFPQIYVHYALGDFLKGRVHLKELRIDLRELYVVKGKDNQVNIKSLKALLPKAGGKPPQIQIDDLSLKIDKVSYKEYVSGIPSTREFNLNINENFKNITDPNALVSLILLKALAKTNIAGLININLDSLKQQVSQAITQQAQSALGQIEAQGQSALKNAQESLTNILQGAGQ